MDVFLDDFLQTARQHELEKQALVEEAARAIAKLRGQDIYSQAAAGQRAQKFVEERIQDPMTQGAQRVAEGFSAPATKRLRAERVVMGMGQGPSTAFEKGVVKVTRKAVENPELILAAPIPVPGASLLAGLGKKGLRGALNNYAPAPV